MTQGPFPFVANWERKVHVLDLSAPFLRNIEGHSSTRPFIVVVLSPLVSLMQDQVRKYSPHLKCTSIGDEGDKEVDDDILRGEYHVVYASPEAILKNPQWRNMVSSEEYVRNVVAIVVDEAHCITSW